VSRVSSRLLLGFVAVCAPFPSTVANAAKLAGIIIPPPQYDKGPFLAPPLVRVVPFDKLPSYCGWPAGSSLNGCAWPDGRAHDGKHCDIFIAADTVGQAAYWLTLRHELAHCRNWPSDHPLD
jgi:hypothetical protein